MRAAVLRAPGMVDKAVAAKKAGRAIYRPTCILGPRAIVTAQLRGTTDAIRA